MNCVEEDPKRANVFKLGKISERQRMTLSDTTKDGEQWRELLALTSNLGWITNT